ncbi:MAG: carboxypeptidase M32 [Nanoarchaeota archaeon]
MNKDLEFVKDYQKRIILMSHASSLLGWDEETNMPKLGINSRAETSALLGKEIHRLVIDDKFFAAVNRLRKSRLTGDDKLLIDVTYRRLLKARKIPESYVEELSRVTTHATAKWREAREKKDFSIFEPHLEKIIELKRKEAKMMGFKGHPYNGLLDGFEEDMTVEKLKPSFDKLKTDLIYLIGKIKASELYKKQKIVLLNKDFPREIQMELVRDVISRMGLKKDCSRIDFSEHPFTTKIGFNDVRITTNIRDDPTFSFSSSIHEAGHALYELGMSENHAYDFLGGEPSTGLHESQSRFWEIMVGLNKNFWKFYSPIFIKKFKLRGTPNQLYREINAVSPSLIRIESDEVHYPLHIILRFELEMGLIDGSIKVKDLPKLWNEKMKEYIGVVPGNDKDGVLQDVHWSNGYIGYFPTYAIGTIYASQLFGAIHKDIKVEELLKKGDYSKIREWLRNKVHKQGSRYFADELIMKLTGRGLDPDSYLKYLNEKYSEIYEL